jgi:hypothetical protein
MGIKTLIADVTAQTSDIAACAITTAKLGNSSVTTAKLADCAVTSAKMANTAFKWVKESVSNMTAAGTAWYTFTCTAAVTVVHCIVDVTAAGGGTVASPSFTVKTTGGSTIIAAFRVSNVKTMSNIVTTATETCSNIKIVSLTAGGSLQVSLSGSLTVTAKGTVIIGYIA